MIAFHGDFLHMSYLDQLPVETFFSHTLPKTNMARKKWWFPSSESPNFQGVPHFQGRTAVSFREGMKNSLRLAVRFSHRATSHSLGILRISCRATSNSWEFNGIPPLLVTRQSDVRIRIPNWMSRDSSIPSPPPPLFPRIWRSPLRDLWSPVLVIGVLSGTLFFKATWQPLKPATIIYLKGTKGFPGCLFLEPVLYTYQIIRTKDFWLKARFRWNRDYNKPAVEAAEVSPTEIDHLRTTLSTPPKKKGNKQNSKKLV